MRHLIILSLLGAAITSESEARKHLLDMQNQPISPLVSQTSTTTKKCEPQCLFEDSEKKNYWCFTFEEPHLKLGWQWKQTANTQADSKPLRHLRMDLEFYGDVYFKMLSDFNVQRLFQNLYTVDVPKFTTKVFTGMIVNQKYQYCPSLGWGMDKVDLSLSMKQQFTNCTKELLRSIWSVEGTWTGKSAKVFENCYRSQAGAANTADPEVNVDFTTWNFLEKRENQLFYGTVNPTSVVYCKDLFGDVNIVMKGGNPHSGSSPQVKSVVGGNNFDAITEYLKLAYMTIFDYLFELSLSTGPILHEGHHNIFEQQAVADEQILQ